MKRAVLAVMLVLLVAGTAAAKDYEVTKKAGDYTVVVKIDRNPPITGDNNLSALIKDATGAEVKDAKVAVEYTMAAMPGMPAVKVKTDAVLKGSEYKAKINFSMPGGWGVAVRITRGGKAVQAKFSVDVR
ncbi:MAG: FixH family protein [Deltaproteobacteria bacterium]|nr:FixH family protein [Deltaproteobacteria bacterium]